MINYIKKCFGKTSNYTMNKISIVKDSLNDFKLFIFSDTIIYFGVAAILSVESVGVIRSFVNDLFLQLIISISGVDLNFDELNFKINGTPINYGMTLTRLLNFTIVAIALYFIIILPYKAIKTEEEKKTCEYCMNDSLTTVLKCSFCHEYFPKLLEI
jgi:large-conductance mechanosensitive channel